MAQLTWLVTGCSSGFGEAFVHSILARGDRVIATGRKAIERLTHLKDSGAATVDLDVTWPEKELQSVIEKAIGIYGDIDVLVNNAGYGEVGLIEDITQEHWLEQFNTNFFGPAHLTRALLPHFRAKRAGKIAFVGSTLGLEGSACIAAYSATKFAMEGYVDCLQAELTPFGIQIIIFEPGYFRTKMMTNVQLRPTAIDDHAALFASFQGFLAAGDGKQPGDAVKGMERMIDVLKGEGVAQGRAMPKRLPLGPDAIDRTKARCKELIGIVDEWEDVIGSTNFDGNEEDMAASMPKQKEE